MSPWEAFVQMHATGDWILLVSFYGTIAAIAVFVALQVIRSRQGALAREAREGIASLQRQMELLRSELRQAEERAARQLSYRTAALAERIGSAEGQCARAAGDVETVRGRIEEVEKSIPNLYDELKEFRVTLTRVFRTELAAVLNSFDNSLTAVLDHMEADLRMGVSRIESIKSMLSSRRLAEQALLPSVEAAPEDAECEALTGSAPGGAGEREAMAAEPQLEAPDSEEMEGAHEEQTTEELGAELAAAGDEPTGQQELDEPSELSAGRADPDAQPALQGADPWSVVARDRVDEDSSGDTEDSAREAA